MDLQTFANSLPDGSGPVKALLRGYTKADGKSTCDYEVLIRPDIDGIYRESIDKLADAVCPNTIDIDVFEKARMAIIRGLEAKIGNDHHVMTSDGPYIRFTALVLNRSSPANRRPPKGQLAIAKKHLRMLSSVGNLQWFRIDRCGEIVVGGKNILT